MRAVLLPSFDLRSRAPNRPRVRWFLPASYPTDQPLGLSFFTMMALQAARAQFRAAIDDAVTAASVPGQPTEPQTMTGLSDMGQD